MEVLLVFAATHVGFKALKQLTAVGVREQTAGLNFTPGIVMAIAACIVIAVVGRNWRSYGFVWPELPRANRWAIPLLILYAVPFTVYVTRFPGGPDRGARSFLGLVLATAIGEELFFRGYIQSRLNEAFGQPWRMAGIPVGAGWLIGALLFGILHGFNTVDYFHGRFAFAWGWAATTVPAGLLFGMIREKTASVVPAMVVHGLLDVWILACLLLTTVPAANLAVPIPAKADLAYAGASPRQKLDLYLPSKASAPAPVVIWIHGGGWLVGDKRSMPRRNFGPAPKPTGPMGPYQIQVPDVAALLAKGYAVVSLNYRLEGTRPTEGVKNSVRDAKLAVRFLRAHAAEFGLDPEKFAVWGNSAGGYIAAMLGATGDQPTIFDPPTSGPNPIATTVQAVIVWYGAEDRFPEPELAISHYVAKAKKLPPFLIANGDADRVISVPQARRLHETVSQAGAKSTLTIVPGAGHEDPAFMATQMAPAFAFIDEALAR